ncbi:MAG TPA: hypothetical protein VFT94_08100 [Gaiellaceae bacterium]|nr:hypothetical protein [Gaiellaceae bacterium]
MSWNSLGRVSRWAILLGVGTAIGLGLGYALSPDSDGGAPTPVLVTKTVIPEGTPAPPPDVEETRAALLEAAEAGDYDALTPYISDGFRYTFGVGKPDGAVEYWRELERTTGESPLEALAAILKMPYVLSRGYYVWPFAYTVESASDLTPQERELLAPLGPLSTLFPEGLGYLGWRAGIGPDGRWVFYVAGD